MLVIQLVTQSYIQLFATPWTVTHQAPLSMGFPSKNPGVGCLFLLQGIFLTQGSNLGLLHYRQSLFHLSHSESQDISQDILKHSHRDM